MNAAQFIKKKILQHTEKKLIRMKDIGRKGKFFFEREGCTFLVQHNYKYKVFVFERLRKHSYDGSLARRKSWKKGDIEYRIGYFIVGKIGRAKGRWTWGQYCPLIPEPDFARLLAKAKKEKVLL